MDDFGYSAAHYVAVSGRTDALQVLLDHRRSMETPDKEGRLPLHKAVCTLLGVHTGCAVSMVAVIRSCGEG